MASLDELRKQDMLRRAGVQTPPPGLLQRAFPNTSMALDQRNMDIADARKTGGFGAAVGQSLRTAGTPLIGLMDDVGTGARTMLDPAAQALKTFATGDATPIGQEQQSPMVRAAMPKPATPMTATAPAASAGREAMAPTQQPKTQAPVASNPLVRQIAPGVFRQGNSYGDSADSAAAFANNKPVSAQNMAAADGLAARYTTPAQPTQEQAQPGAGLYVGQDTGGFGLLDKNRIALRNAQMDVQQLKPGSGKALAALLQQQTDAPKMDLERQQMEASGRSAEADRAMRSTELMAKLGESSADRALRSQELADNSLVNAAKREQIGVETGAAKQLADLRSAYLNAKTPEEQAAAVAKINALSGKAAAADEYMAVAGGETVDAMGNVVKNPDVLVNKRTGQPVQGGQQAKPQAQAGAPTVGTVKSGYRFKGGDPASLSSWEKV
jgi:hypothetical protein